MVGCVLAMSPRDRLEQQAALESRFARLHALAQARTVLLYARAFPEEIDTGPMLSAVLTAGQRLILPRVDRRENRLRLFQVVDLGQDLRPGVLGIPEPRRSCPEVEPFEIDWALVPGLAFDSRGYRVGRGAGHYDRLLPGFRPESPRWSLCFDCQWVDDLPAEAHDERLDGVVSPSREVVISR